MNITSYNRYQAFAVHLAVSFFIFLILLLLVFYVWYPGIFFESEKGWKAIALIAGVDLVLGPLCTLIVFNPAKKSLKMDLAVIALLQAGALIAGSYLIHERRPVAFLMFEPESGVMTLYAANLSAETIRYINEHDSPLFYYHSSSDPINTELIDKSNFRLNKENLQVLTFNNFQSDQNNTTKSQPVYLQIDRGRKDGVYLTIDNFNTLRVEKVFDNPPK